MFRLTNRTSSQVFMKAEQNRPKPQSAYQGAAAVSMGQSRPSADDNSNQSSTFAGNVLMGGGEMGNASESEKSNIAQQGFDGNSQALPFKEQMESAFGVDLSGIKAFTNPRAGEAANLLGAEAFTSGSNIAFDSQNPTRETVAHEVTHAVQTDGSNSFSPLLKGERSSSPANLEAEADYVGKSVDRGARVDALTPGNEKVMLKPKTFPPNEIPEQRGLPPGFDVRTQLYENGSRFNSVKKEVKEDGIEKIAATLETIHSPKTKESKKTSLWNKLRSKGQVPAGVKKEDYPPQMAEVAPYDVDHVMPLAQHWKQTGFNCDDGTRHDIAGNEGNLQLMLSSENRQKGAEGDQYAHKFYVGKSFSSGYNNAPRGSKTIAGRPFIVNTAKKTG